MQILFQFEAQLRQIAGTGERSLEITDGTSLADALDLAVPNEEQALRERILNTDGELQPSVMLFVNDAPVTSAAASELSLTDGDRVLLLPPISGG